MIGRYIFSSDPDFQYLEKRLRRSRLEKDTPVARSLKGSSNFVPGFYVHVTDCRCTHYAKPMFSEPSDDNITLCISNIENSVDVW